MRPSLIILIIAMILSVPAGGPGSALAQDEDAQAPRSSPSQNSGTPRRHFRMRQIAELEAAEALRIYDLIKGALSRGYAESNFPGSDGYQALTRYNDAPYVSSTHGNHYLNNYANDIAVNYGRYEKAGTLPQGSVIFKDSFSVTESRQSFSDSVARQITLGPLFVMRKMEPGFNPVTGDWQYIQIQPDGKLLGMTNGEGSDQVEYCISCHLAREQYDHLYFVPDHRRVTP